MMCRFTPGATKDFFVGVIVVATLMLMGLVDLSAVSQVADLVVEEIWLSPERPAEGEEMIVVALVANRGDTFAEAIWLSFLLDERLFVGEGFVEFLEPGGLAEVEVLFAAPPPGEHAITALVDPEQLIEESNEENNRAQASFGVGFLYEEGWCCLEGEVFPAIKEECIERGGLFFASQEEAEDACLGAREGPSIPVLKGPNWMQFVGELVTIEGIFVRDPLPMLITDLEVVLVNTRMPDTEYIVLLGGLAEELDPRENGGAWLRVTGVPRVIDDEVGYLGEYVGLEVVAAEQLYRPYVYAPEVVDMEVRPISDPNPHLYAILFSGGGTSASNHTRYWNDLKFMYSTLINEYGFHKGNIAVLYADGKGRDSQLPVHYTGTEANLQTVFTLLRSHATSQDTVFIFTTNHGGGLEKTATYCWPAGGRLDANGDEGTEPIFEKNCAQDFNKDGDLNDQVAWDEDLTAWGGEIYDDSFTTWLTNLAYDRLIIVMEQCFSGGLIRDMAIGSTNRVVMSACGEYEGSRCIISGPNAYLYDEFSYYFTCAINGADPKGSTVNADANGDNRISMVEAFNYAQKNDTAPETPWYEDSGDGAPHSGSMPKSGDGALGTNTFLD